MFRCMECKGWLKIGKIDTEISNQNCKIKVQNMPVKVCPKCGKIYIYDIVKQNAFNYALEKGSTNIDYDEYDAEASASQLIL